MKMKKYRKRKIGNLTAVSLVAVHLSLFTLSCTMENYDSGDGDYSYLRADFAEAHTNAQGQIDYAINDDGETIRFAAPFSVKWTEKTDTFYRALLYYNRLPDSNKPVTMQRVYVLQPRDISLVESPSYDPVTFESAWLSRCQLPSSAYYVNLTFLLKTGQPDNDQAAIQSIGVASETVNDTLRLTLLHGQGNVPQYYSTRVYASIPVSGSQAVVLTVNTYDGKVVRQVR